MRVYWAGKYDSPPGIVAKGGRTDHGSWLERFVRTRFMVSLITSGAQALKENTDRNRNGSDGLHKGSSHAPRYEHAIISISRFPISAFASLSSSLVSLRSLGKAISNVHHSPVWLSSARLVLIRHIVEPRTYLQPDSTLFLHRPVAFPLVVGRCTGSNHAPDIERKQLGCSWLV